MAIAPITAQASKIEAAGSVSLPASSAADLRKRRLALQVPFAGLTALPGKGIQTDAPNVAVFDAGTVNPLDSSRARMEFLLRNDGKTSLLLSRLQSSCHCASAIVEAIDGVRVDSQTPLELAPGRVATVQVTVDLAGQPAGPLVKTVTVYLKDSPRPAAQLQIRADLQPIVTISPNTLDFGQTPSGETKAETVTVSVDRRLIAGNAFPALISTSPSVQITPAVVVVSQPPAGFHASRMLTRSYQVTVAKDAALGPISGSLVLSAPPKASAAQQTAFGSSSALLTGRVSGDISAAPDVVAFGAVNYGREVSRQVILSGKSDEMWRGLKAASASPSVTVQLADTAPAFTDGQLLPRNHALNVTMLGTLAPGPLQTEIKLTLSNGERLLIPVTAYISATPIP